MRSGQKVQILQSLLPGLAITALIICADSVGWLTPLENWLYDKRAKFCQQFTPPPTKQLYHMDIDDAAIESIGRWPWPRETVAEILDELNRAGVKVVATDVTFPDPQPPTYLPNGKMIDDDAILAESIQKFGHVLVPVNFNFDRTPVRTPMQQAIAAELHEHLTISFDALRAKLANEYPRLSLEDYLPILREIVAQRVESEMSSKPGTLAEIQQRLLGADATLVDRVIPTDIQKQYRIYQSQMAIAGLGKTIAQPMPYVLTPQNSPEGALPMIPALAQVARYTAFVDHLPHDDGVERDIPLWVLYRGRLYPQMGLALACATLDVPLSNLEITDKALTIPVPGGRKIVIPTTSYYSARLGRRVDYLMDIPWFGTSDWRTMYDYPSHLQSVQHLPIGNVWQLAEARKIAINNNLAIDERMKQLNVVLGEDYLTKFLFAPPDSAVIDSRLGIGARVVKEATEFLADTLKLPRAQLKPEEGLLVDTYHKLQSLLTENRRINDAAVAMKQRLGGKSVLIGSIATSAFDFAKTPLHTQAPGVIVHGVIFNAIMINYLWRNAPFVDAAIATAGMGVLASLAVTLFSPWAALLATTILLVGYAALNGLFIFGYENIILGAAGPLLAGASVWAIVTFMRFLAERSAKAHIKRRFESYADRKLVDYVLAHPEQNVFAGEEREMTCVFTDMQGYTSLMERLGKNVVPALNEYMGRMAAIIQEEGGYLNKFLGDGIMFFYGAPEIDSHHAQRAVRAVLKMQQTGIPGFNAWLKEQNIDLQVAVRAGVGTGLMIVGDAGSQRRADYTVLGDSVNLTSRLESANKHIGTMTMVTERTAELCGGEFLLRPVAKIQVVGKSEPVTTYEPLAYANQATDAQKRLAEVTREIFALFVASDFERCLHWIEIAEKEFGQSKLFALYARNCQQYLKATRPENFDGRIVLDEK